jgi:pimeloyl-ACP methyl ester carboxylesterase
LSSFDGATRYVSTRTRVVARAGAELFVAEAGDTANPTVVLVHGYPDTHSMWDELVELLRGRLHTVAYDVRGMGRSTAPDTPAAFALDELAADLGAVIDAVAPGERVHLVGHDWGAFQCWEAVADPSLSARIASFTAVAGPRVDAATDWVRRRLRPSLRALAQLLDQARRSWYIAAFQIPGLAERALVTAMERAWPGALRRLEGIEPRPGHPAATLRSDARAGLALYRTNARRLARARGRPPVKVPVQLIVPTRDRHISNALYDDADHWAASVTRLDIAAGHWVPRSHPDVVAGAIAEFVER